LWRTTDRLYKGRIGTDGKRITPLIIKARKEVVSLDDYYLLEGDKGQTISLPRKWIKAGLRQGLDDFIGSE